MASERVVWVKDLKPGMKVEAAFLIQAVKEMLTKKGDPFVILSIADKTGSIDVKVWGASLDPSYKYHVGLKAGEVANLSIAVEEYEKRITGKVEFIHSVDPNPISADFYKASTYDPEEMWAEFCQFIDFKSSHFEVVAKELLDAESTELFKSAPAATGMHHAFRHGLLEHTLQMLQCARALLNLPFFAPLNHDLCMFGIMFHDFGKIYEYSTSAGFPKRVQGVLVPHIPMTAARIYEAANRYGVPEMVRDHMMHVVLAHHRLLEWGSPVKFACPEAAFVHYVDNLHGDVFGMIQKREEAVDETIKHGYYSDSVTILKQPFEQIINNAVGVKDGF